MQCLTQHPATRFSFCEALATACPDDVWKTRILASWANRNIERL